MKWLALLSLLLLTTSAPLPLPPVAAMRTKYVYYFPQVGHAPESLKKGVGMPYADCDKLATLGIRWAYNWSSETWNCPGVENVPMAWAGVPQTVRGNSDWLMGFNEPDRPDQANLTPEQAAIKWRGIEAMYPERKLVAPAPSHLDPEWLARFRDAYIAAFDRPPRLDALAVHCYLPTADECIALVQQFEDWAAAWNVPEVWVTEFSFVDTKEEKQFIRYLQADPMVSRYGWFALSYRGFETWAPARDAQAPLVDSTGKLTAWGSTYK